MKTIVNMTPHDVTVYGNDNRAIFIYKASGKLIRLSQKNEKVGDINGIPTIMVIFGEPEGLPEYDPDTIYIVSAFVKSALPDRTDLVVPSDPVRDPDGRIIGCRAFGV